MKTRPDKGFPDFRAVGVSAGVLVSMCSGEFVANAIEWFGADQILHGIEGILWRATESTEGPPMWFSSRLFFLF